MLYLFVKGKKEEKSLYQRWRHRYFSLEETTLAHTKAKVCYIHLSDEAADGGKKAQKAVKRLAKVLRRQNLDSIECLYANKISNRFIQLCRKQMAVYGVDTHPYNGDIFFHQIYEQAVDLQLDQCDPLHTKVQILDAGLVDEKLESAAKLSAYARQIGILTKESEAAGRAARQYYLEEGATISVSDDLSRLRSCDLLYLVDSGTWDIPTQELKKSCKILFHPRLQASYFSPISHGVKELRLFLPAKLSGQSAARLKRAGISVNLVCAYLYERGICEKEQVIREVIWY